MADAKAEFYGPDGMPILTLGTRAYKVLTVAVGTASTGALQNDVIAGANNVVPVLQGSGSAQYKNPAVTVNKSTKRVEWSYGSVPPGERDPSMKMNVVVY